MKFGVREICDVVFKAKASGNIGKFSYGPGQPVLYIDTAKTSTLEGAATTVYATGGSGNNRLIAWEGEKTLTFTVEDALLSPIGFSILSGAGIFDSSESKKAHVHTTAQASMTVTSTEVSIDLTDSLKTGEAICSTAPVFVMITDADGSITGDFVTGLTVTDGKKLTATASEAKLKSGEALSAGIVFVDFYIEKATVQTLDIEMKVLDGFYYVEASTLFRRQIDGKDLQAELVFPNVKVQSNFSFSMAATGDPSTFSFTMDAFPGYTMFDKTKKVLCAIQIVDDTVADTSITVTDSVTAANTHLQL